MSDDGWGGRPDVDALLMAYGQIELEMNARPVTKRVFEKEEPKEQTRLISNGQVQSEIVYLPDESSSDDDEGYNSNKKPTYFRPPLQVQRNQFVRNQLMRFKNDILKEDYEKMAVLGCGELSLERFIAHDMSRMGIYRVVSVDIDESVLAKGNRTMPVHLEKTANSIKNFDYYPVLMEYYHGDILKYDAVLEKTGCVVSTEVIEHIPEEEAEIFVRTVVGKVRPRLFILSTPNHEYNEAFGMEPGEFRHDDHKYEFTREQFKEWISRILSDYPDYQYTIHMVGNMHGYFHFGGATQFAVIWTTEPRSPVEEHPNLYEKTGSNIVFGGLDSLVVEKGKEALKKWFETHKLTQENLVTTDYAKFWKIYLEELYEFMALPESVRSEVREDRVLKMLAATVKYRLHAEFRDIGQSDKSHLIIPEHERVDTLLRFLE